jgi:hypothetical protein
MSSVLSSAPFTRRTAALTLGLGGLSALLATRPALTAQPATPAATPVPRIGHPLVGAWQWTDLSSSSDSDPAIGVFYPDGTYLTYESFSGVGIGFWRATGERTAELVVTFQTLAGAWQTLAGPEEWFEPDYVPTGHVFDVENGTVTVTWHMTLDDALTTFVASGDFVVRGPGGDIVYSDSTVGHAVKLVILTTESPATPGS